MQDYANSHLGSAAVATPWGKAQHAEPYGTGITFYGTASHGGFRVEQRLNQTIPIGLRIESGWYEEDCEAALVMVAFPDRFRAEDVAASLGIVKNYFPDRYMAWTGTVLDPVESSELRRRAFDLQTRDQYVVTSAWGSWHETVPNDMVGVLAVRRSTKEPGGFLVPAAEYKNAAGQGFIIDPDRHAAWEPPSGITRVTNAPAMTALHNPGRSPSARILAERDDPQVPVAPDQAAAAR